MADPFTEANRINRQVSSVDRERAVLTTRREAEQAAEDRRRAQETQDEARDIRRNQENRAQARFETEQAQAPTQEQINLQNQILVKELEQARNKLDKNDTYDAFDRYVTDGDPRHLNNLLKNNKRVKRTFGEEIASIDRVDPKNDQTLIQQSNLDPDIFAEEEAIKRYVKVTNADGSKDIVDLNRIYAATGYLEHATEEKIDKLTRQAELGAAERRAKGLPASPPKEIVAIREFADMMGLEQPKSPEEVREVVDLMNDILPKDATGGGKPTAAQKNLREAENRQEQLVNKFGGQDEFFSTDFSEQENRVKAAADIAAIEKLRDVKLSSAEKKKLLEINKLINLGETAGGELSPQATGLLDNVLAGAKKFIFDNVDETEARSAYAAYRNVVRHALFGSVLTEGERKSFNEAFGSLKEKLGPVLTQLETNLQNVQEDLNTIVSVGDPFVMHYRVGASQERIANMLANLDERIQALREFKDTGRLVVAEPAQRLQSIEQDTEQPKGSLKDFKFSAGD